MEPLSIDNFEDFFHSLHGVAPYRWQRELAERAIQNDWPGAIDLPTGSGKTASIDIAVFALAAQAHLPVELRNAPRRIFFCVNRRVIVDEAYERSLRIARKLMQAEQRDKSEILARVAAALRVISGIHDQKTPPLDVLELRGGIYRDNRWTRSLTQPTIVCTTVDQLGSRLLFRGYGVSENAAPIQAALIAYDSLILLDEAHISRPFYETLQNVRIYLDPEKWAEQGLPVKPFVIAPMTATPPDGVSGRKVLRLNSEDRKNESLKRRLKASKIARLLPEKNTTEGAVREAEHLALESPRAVGIIVNRVATAREIYSKLREKHPNTPVELVIGSMRPMDRDEQARRLGDLIGHGRPERTAQSSFVVSTQCLEVGADYDFDALVTEAASLDALRQRFGRLNRGGRPIDAHAAILINEKSIKEEEKLDDAKPLDRIYGNAAVRTWHWLNKYAIRETETDQRKGKTSKAKATGAIDFGIDSFDRLLSEHGEQGRIPNLLLAPSAQLTAPVILPAYVDLWCQTSPRPIPDPDIDLFLHGARTSEPDVQVCWRADLKSDENTNELEHWPDIVALLPPTAAECMSVPLSRLRRWLCKEDAASGKDGDFAGTDEPEDSNDPSDRKGKIERQGVVWRGIEKTKLLSSMQVADIRPGDTLVLPLSGQGWDDLGHIPLGDQGLQDVAESAFTTARNRYALRLHPSVQGLYRESPALAALFKRVQNADDPLSLSELQGMLKEAANSLADNSSGLKQKLQGLAEKNNLRFERYPDNHGLVLQSRRLIEKSSLFNPLPVLDDGEDEPSYIVQHQPVLLSNHSQHVADQIRHATACLPLSKWSNALTLAAELHDLGKADERFQAMLRRSDRTDAWLLNGQSSTMLAKSDGLPMTRIERRQARERAGLPNGFRHEMLSVQIAERSDHALPEASSRDLVLHLIAAHHGYARPFAPVVIDDDPPTVEIGDLTIEAEERRGMPPHRLDSGVSERFWSLTRRFGWWGLSYLEACLRIADQQASAMENDGKYESESPLSAVSLVIGASNNSAQSPQNQLELTGLDGSNPLGFLAALGTLRVLTEECPQVQPSMSWAPSRATWIPVLHFSSSEKITKEHLLHLLQGALAGSFEKHAIYRLLESMEEENSHDFFAEILRQANTGNRVEADWLAALSADGVSSDAINRLQTVRKDYFRGNLKSIISRANEAHLARSLFSIWDYSDALDNQSLHWDPGEDRRHAWQWSRPSGDPERKTSGGMLGANRLALEAIPIFSSTPGKGELLTIGFSGNRSHNTRLTWPLWQVSIQLPLVKTLLSWPLLQRESPSERARREIVEAGVLTVLRTNRILVGKTPNFTPARRIA